VDPTDEEFSGSPFTKIKATGVPTGLSVTAGITGNLAILLPAGAAQTGSYQEWRTERRGENPHPLEGTLQGRRFMPGFHRKVGFAGGGALARPSKISVYLTQDLSSGALPDGTDLATAKFQVMRYNPNTLRWEPLFGQTHNPNKSILKATLVSTGELAVAVLSNRGLSSTSSSGSDCGSLGVEVLLPFAVLLVRRRRACRR
jgi:hypothetical protein